jgi:hypothetical protein
MFRNIAVLITLPAWCALSAVWLVYWIRMRAVSDAAVTTLAVGAGDWVLVLDTARGRWLVVFVMVSIVQAIAARYVFGK